jgi:hypothetical protein
MLNMAIATRARVTPRSPECEFAGPLGLRISGASMLSSILGVQFSLNDVEVVVMLLGGINEFPSNPDTPVKRHWYGYLMVTHVSTMLVEVPAMEVRHPRCIVTTIPAPGHPAVRVGDVHVRVTPSVGVVPAMPQSLTFAESKS